jgi:multidrug efflux pump subunit AcrB
MIVMTSFTLISGGAPLVIATGASTSARGPLAIAAFSAMVAFARIAVLLVPSFCAPLSAFPRRG